MKSPSHSLTLEPVLDETWALPGAIGQLAVEGGAARDGGLGLLEQRLALQPVGRAGHGRGPGQGLQGRGGHTVPRGVPPEGGFVLARGAFAVQFVLHHGDPAELRTPSAEWRRDGEREAQSHEHSSLVATCACQTEGPDHQL